MRQFLSLTVVPGVQSMVCKLLDSTFQVPKYSAVSGLEYFLACKSTPLKLVFCPLFTFTVTGNEMKNAFMSVEQSCDLFCTSYIIIYSLFKF